MISILLPTRQRPHNIERLWQSIKDTAEDIDDIEMVLYIDDDDTSYDGLELSENVLTIRGPRIVLSECWNRCYEKSKGDILMHCGDDIIFRTQGWDTIVRSEFEKFPDNIVFVYGDDGGPAQDFGTHGFIHRRWAEASGFFVPPYFSSDYNDTWLNDVAKLINRHRHVDIYTEHMHPAFNKAPVDDNHRERLERHRTDRVDDLYRSRGMQQQRQENADKLREIMQ